jgi:hypothetical protein
MKQFLILAAFGALVASSQAQTKAESVKKEGLQRLLNAYPNHLKAVGENHIEWLDGTKMTYDDGKGKKAFKDLLDNPDIEDQFVFDYTAGVAETAPARNHDPGRIRYEPFFLQNVRQFESRSTKKSHDYYLDAQDLQRKTTSYESKRCA